jgi:hypothetical protein
MYEHYHKITAESKDRPTFKYDIEDVCNPQPKSLMVYYNFQNTQKDVKDRSKTFHDAYDFKTSLKVDKVYIPKNNPLQGMAHK